MNTPAQNEVLKREARRLGIPVREFVWRWYGRIGNKQPQSVIVVPAPQVKPYRFETVTVRGHLQNRWIDRRTGRFAKKPT